MFEVVSPVTEKVIATVEELNPTEVENRVVTAQKGFESWRKVPPGKRAELLRNFARKVEDNVEELALIEVKNSGHTISNARWEANNVKDVLYYYAGAVERLSGLQIPVSGGIDVTFKEPIGVVGIIVPWNFPMPIAGWGFAPALAAGC